MLIKERFVTLSEAEESPAVGGLCCLTFSQEIPRQARNDNSLFE